MTIDYDALVSSAQTIKALAPRTRVTKPNPFMPLVLAALNSGEPKQVGPLSPTKPNPDAKSPLEQVHGMVTSAGQTLKKERAEAGEAIKVTARKALIPNPETGVQEGWVQVYAGKEGNEVPTTDAAEPAATEATEPTRTRSRGRAN